MAAVRVDAEGIVKEVLSGDRVVVRGTPNRGPPPEKTVALAYIVCPKLGRRPSGKESEDRKDEVPSNLGSCELELVI